MTSQRLDTALVVPMPVSPQRIFTPLLASDCSGDYERAATKWLVTYCIYTKDDTHSTLYAHTQKYY